MVGGECDDLVGGEGVWVGDVVVSLLGRGEGEVGTEKRGHRVGRKRTAWGGPSLNLLGAAPCGDA